MTPNVSKMRSEGPLGPPWGTLGASSRSKEYFCTSFGDHFWEQMGSKMIQKSFKKPSSFWDDLFTTLLEPNVLEKYPKREPF